MSSLCILWDLLETPESLLTILDDSKGFTIIPFVPHTIIFAVKTAAGGDDKLWINLAWPTIDDTELYT